MPPKKQPRTLSRTFSQTSDGSSKPKLKQNKLDFSFHSTTTASRPFGSRPLSVTPSFGIPAAGEGKEKGKQKQQQPEGESSNEDEGGSLWSERLAPRSVEELAVHPKKVAQVRGWVGEAFSGLGRNRKVLALTGPAGAGKSATIRALATDLDYDILEWHNDTPTFDSSAPFTPGSSFIERFTDFLQKAAKFPTLDLQSSSSSDLTLDSPLVKPNRLILIEDLPNLQHLPTKQLFQAALEQYIQQSSQLCSRGWANVPIVLVVTESTPREDEDRWVGDSGGNGWRERIASTMDTRSALGEGVRKNPSYAEIRFNPVAPTIVIKALKRAMEQSGSKGGLKVWTELLQAVAQDSNGDLRAAVNCLQFVGADMARFQASGRKGKERERAMRKMLPLVSGRESSLVLFHALGRVLYNKREGDPGEEPRTTTAPDVDDDDSDQEDDDHTQLRRRLEAAMQSIVRPFSSSSDSVSQLPDHMAHLDRRPSKVAVDQLWADLPVDSSVFQLYLHQNFPQFCGEVEQCEEVLDCFSAADALTPQQDQYRYSSLLAYYSFLMTVRGTLMHLPSPVERKGQKMGKATWWDVQKKLRSTLIDIDEFKASSQGGRAGAVGRDTEDVGGGRFKRTKFNNPSFDAADEAVERSDAGLGDESYSALLRCDTLSLVTEVLPLLAKIRVAGDRDGKVYELARMRFEYAGVADIASRTLDEHETGVQDEDEEDAAGDETRGKERHKGAKKPDTVVTEESAEKMYLSDDDIGEF